MRYAVIDVGSNTIRLCIYEKHDGGLSLIVNERVMALLGSKTTNGALNEEGIRAASEALLKLKEIAEREEAEHLFVFATAALRNITNTQEATAEIMKNTGLLIDVLSGDEEALLTYAGAAKAQNIADGLIADIGGGSTELVLIKEGKVLAKASLAIGSLTAFVRFVKKRPAEREQIMHLREHMRSMIAERFTEGTQASVLYGIGGAARTASELEKILYPASGGAIQTLEMLLYRLLDDEKLAEKSILAASPDRLDTALPGVAILCEAAAFFGCKRLDVCKAGVREGYLQKKLGESGEL